jgi:hypothetical protein
MPSEASRNPPRGKAKKTIERERLTALVSTLDQIITDPKASAEARVSACALLLKLREASK